MLCHSFIDILYKDIHYFRLQTLDSTVRFSDRQLPVTNLRGDILFKSFSEMFDGSGGVMAGSPRIYSFSGKNIMNDMHW